MNALRTLELLFLYPGATMEKSQICFFLAFVFHVFPLTHTIADEQPSAADLGDLAKGVIDAVVTGLDDRIQVVADISPEVPHVTLGPVISNDGSSIAYCGTKSLVLHHLSTNHVMRFEFADGMDKPRKILIPPNPNGDECVVVLARSRLYVFHMSKSKLIDRRALARIAGIPKHWSGSANGENFVGATNGNWVQVLRWAGEPTIFHSTAPAVPLAEDRQATVAISDDGKTIFSTTGDGEISFTLHGIDPPGDPFSIKIPCQKRALMAAGNGTLGILDKSRMSFLTYPSEELGEWNIDNIGYVNGVGEFKPLVCQMVSCNNRQSFVAAVRLKMHSKVAMLRYVQSKGPSQNVAMLRPVWFLPESKKLPRHINWDGEGKRVAYKADGKIRVLEIPDYYRSQGRDLLDVKLTPLVDAAAYSELEEIGAALLRKESEIGLDPYQYWIQVLQEYTSDVVREEIAGIPPKFYTNWLEEDQDSKTAKFLIGQWYVNAAWAARGDGYADQLTNEQGENFGKLMQAGQRALGDVTKDGAPPQSIALALDIAKGIGSADLRKEAYLNLLNSHYTNYAHGQCKAAEMLLPRWGGAPDALKQYLESTADGIGGDDGDKLYAQVALHLMAFFPMDDFPALELSQKRIFQGLLFTKPGRDVALGSYAQLLIWCIKHNEFDKAIRILEHYQQHEVFFLSPIDDPAIVDEIARYLHLHRARSANK